jgi:hypothetical protein
LVLVRDGTNPTSTDFSTVRPEVDFRGEHWSLRYGALRAEYQPRERIGVVAADEAWVIDPFLRFLYALLMIQGGGFLLHAASVVRNGEAFVFAGASGAGKTTISRLAPPDAAVLSDEVSCLRPTAEGYAAFGTPFRGGLNVVAQPIRAPVRALYLLCHGQETRIEPVKGGAAVRAVISNMLHASLKESSAPAILDAACEFVRRTPVYRLEFRPEPSVWEAIA